MTGTPLLETTTRRLDRRAAILQATGRIPSLVTGLVRGGDLVWSAARGTFAPGVDPLDLQYRIGSITKSFIAVAVMQLRDAGALGLNDPLEEHVRGTPFGDRTIAQLLTHTAGLSAELPGPWWERSAGPDTSQLHAALADGTVLDRAGRHVHYSNIAFAVLGEVIARTAGRDWAEVVDEKILTPLQMSRTTALPAEPHATGYAVHPHADVLLPEKIQHTGAMGPAGQLWSTPNDLARWAAFLGGDTGEVLASDTLAEMCEPGPLADDQHWTTARGLGLQLSRDKGRVLVGHGGSMPGFQAGLRVDRKTSIGTFVVMNCTTADAVEDLESPFDIMAECEPEVPPVWVAAPDVEADLLALTGSWFWGTSEAVLRVRGDGWLRMEHVSGMASTSDFRPNDDGTFTGRHGYFRNETLRVVTGDDGAGHHLDIGTFIFTRRPYEPGSVIPGGTDDGGWPVRAEG